MSADRKLKVYLDKLPDEVYQSCEHCRAQILMVGSLELKKCRLAELEQKLGQKPSFSQAADQDIDISKVPVNCPNGY